MLFEEESSGFTCRSLLDMLLSSGFTCRSLVKMLFEEESSGFTCGSLLDTLLDVVRSRYNDFSKDRKIFFQKGGCVMK